MLADFPGEGSWAAQCCGYTFFVKDNRLPFSYNFLGRDVFTVIFDTDAPVGDGALRDEMEPAGGPDLAARTGVAASVDLYIDRKLVGAVGMPHTVPNAFSTEGLAYGHDGGGVVTSDAYREGFAFIGTLKHVTFDLSGIPDRRYRHRSQGRHGAPPSSLT
jgi:hypothetical protein